MSAGEDRPLLFRPLSRLSPLQAALRSRNKRTSRSLLGRGADKNVDNATTPLDITVPYAYAAASRRARMSLSNRAAAHAAPSPPRPRTAKAHPQER